MKNMILAVFLCAGLRVGPALGAAAAQSCPFRVERFSPGLPAGTLYGSEQANFRLIRYPHAQDEDFSSWYVVEVPKRIQASDLELYGKIEHYGESEQEKNSLAVMQLEWGAPSQLAGFLYQNGHFSGPPLVQLDGTLMAEAAAEGPSPVHAVEQVLPSVESLVSGVSEPRIQGVVESLARIHTRYHGSETGQGVTRMLAELYQEAARIHGRDDVEVRTFDHGERTLQKSLVVSIPGRKNDKEIVVVGSHIDSINQRDPRRGRSPGGDDDAAGTAVNLELFRRLMEMNVRFDRTLEIHGYAAEEAGLVGSLNIARAYIEAQKAVIAMLQNDMNFYTSDGQAKIWFVTSNTSDKLNDMLGRLVSGYVKIPWDKQALWGGTSDHEAWRRRGIPTAFPFENPRADNPRIHTPDDTTEGANWTQSAAFARLALAYAAHFAGIRLGRD